MNIQDILALFGQNLKALGVFGLLGFGGFVIYSFIKGNTSKLKETVQSNINKKIEELEKVDETIKEDKEKINTLSTETTTIQDQIKDIISEQSSPTPQPKSFSEIKKQIESGWKDI